MRITADWHSISTGVPANPRDPADPAYDFARLDAAVADATARGLEVILFVSSAPAHAEGPGREPSAPPGSWRPDPGAVAAFGSALASRYSGHFAGLPRVGDYQLWNEPNLSTYLTPQYDGGALVAPAHYRAMLNAFYDAVKAVDPANLVLTGGTAPFGDPPGGRRTGPLLFWRHVLCLEGRRALRPTACPEKARFDVLAHHPINGAGAPTGDSPQPDDASTSEFGELVAILRAAERRGTTGTPGRHPVWATELWWDSNPPDTFEGIPLARHARFIEQALYLLWRQGARVVLNLQVRDSVYDPANPFVDLTTGLFFIDGTPKPALAAFRFPLVAERLAKSRVRVWGRAPVEGRLRIERAANGGWRRAEAVEVGEGEVFRARLDLRGKQRLRARIGSERSLVWRLRRDAGSDVAAGRAVVEIVEGEYTSLRQFCDTRVDGRALQGDGADDSIGGSRRRDLLRGGGGGDRLVGRGGGDCLEAQSGADRVAAGGGGDVVNGGGGDDRVEGGPGADAIDGGKGADRLLAGSGADAVRAADGTVDRIGCGPGRDRAIVDARDRTGADCERVRVD